MKRIAPIMTLLAVFGWFLSPALALCCQDCEQCVDACGVTVAPVISPVASCCSSQTTTTCNDAPQDEPVGQGCCSQCQCTISNAPETESMMATVIVEPEDKQTLVLFLFATIDSDTGWAPERRFGISPKPPGDPPGRQLLLQSQILRL